jgi:hypothetical protein
MNAYKTSTERVAEIRTELKNALPKCKFSIRKNDYNSMSIYLLSSPVDFGTDRRQVNHYWIHENYEGEQKEILMTIKEIAFKGINYRETGDYGTQPDFYIDLSIGKYDKPYQVK